MGRQGAQYQVSLQGNDWPVAGMAAQAAGALKRNPKLRDVGTDVDDAGLRQNIIIDRAKAARLGVSLGAIDGALYDAFGQRQISTIYDINQYRWWSTRCPTRPPRLRAGPGRRAHRDGALIPLGHCPSGTGPGPPDRAPEPVHGDEPELQPGARREHGRRQGDRSRRHAHARRHPPRDDGLRLLDGRRHMLILILAAILTVYIVLGMLYESLIHPVTILSTLPAAGVGALLALWATNTDCR
jgi:multidrug efflux pump